MATLLRRNLLRRGPAITTVPLVAPLSNLSHPFTSSSSTTTIEVETRRPFEAHRCETPSRVVPTTSSELLSFFHQMSVMRRMEITADILYKSKVIRGFCHLYDGQEAIASGMEATITTNDNVITAYRDHCIYLGRGGNLEAALAELMGRRDGCSKGKGGSMHFYKKDANYYGGHGIVGAQIPLGCGLAFAQKYNKENNVTFTFYGDGAANQGQFFEALNMSALWNLPVVLVCENNLFGMGTSSAKASKVSEFYTRGDYVPGIKVDGMDVLAVKQACKFAKEYVLQNGPLILEMDCYRYHGHSMSDPGTTYRKRLEVDTIRKERDPIGWVKQLILSHDFATEQELKDTEKAIKKMVEEAVTQAKNSPEPDPSDLFNDVYAKGIGAEAFGADRKEIRVNLP